jgi:predicted amidohydrolase
VQVVSAVQFAPELLNVRKNLQTALQMTNDAALKGADLIVLPELCVSGHTLRNAHEAASCAQTKDGYQTDFFMRMARERRCTIVFGYVELFEGKLYNSAAVVGPFGLDGNAQKHNLTGSDAFWATFSEVQVPQIVLRDGRLGVLIDRDLANRYRPTYHAYDPRERFYPKGAVDAIAVPSGWNAREGFPDVAWLGLAEDSGSNVIVANRTGAEDGTTFTGGSCVIDRNRKVYSHGSSLSEAAIVGGLIV